MSNQDIYMFDVFYEDGQCGSRLSKILFQLDSHYQPQISSVVDIEKYANKLCDNSVVIIAKHRDTNDDIGVAAFYVNDAVDKIAFLSTIGLVAEYHGTDLSGLIIGKVFSICKDRSFLEIDLEVDSGNVRAINFYKKHGFQFNVKNCGSSINTVCMTKKL